MAVGLAHEKSRRYAAEDVKAVASAIRCAAVLFDLRYGPTRCWHLHRRSFHNLFFHTTHYSFRHQGNHFQRMFSEVARWTAALDHPAAIKALLEFVVVGPKEKNTPLP